MIFQYFKLNTQNNMSSTEQEISVEDFNNLEIQCASVKGKYNSAKFKLDRLKKKFNDSFEFMLNTKNEQLIFDYLIHMDAKVGISHYARIFDYTNKQGKTHKAYMNEYNQYLGKVSKTSKPPQCVYWEDFDGIFELFDFNKETGRYEFNKETYETKYGHNITICKNTVCFCV